MTVMVRTVQVMVVLMVWWWRVVMVLVMMLLVVMVPGGDGVGVSVVMLGEVSQSH
jgi:hypothetical protein